jgi:hypothetical protein
VPQARSRLQHASTMRTSVPLLSTTSKGRHRAQAAFRRILAICAVALAAVGLVALTSALLTSSGSGGAAGAAAAAARGWLGAPRCTNPMQGACPCAGE